MSNRDRRCGDTVPHEPHPWIPALDAGTTYQCDGAPQGLGSDVTRSAEADAAQARIDAIRIGTPVRYWPGIRSGEGRISRTRTPVWDVCGHPVVSVEGYAGGIALTHVERLDGDQPAEAPAGGPEAPRCRPVELDDGSVVRVQGMPDGGVPPELTAALTDVVDAVRRRHAAEHPSAVRPTDAGPDQCLRSDVHGPHRWRHKRVARQCPGLPVTQCRAEYPGSGQHGARIVACGRPRGHEGDHVEYIGDDAGPSWPVIPPARLTTTEWQRQNAAEVRAESADEIRSAIFDIIRQAVTSDHARTLADWVTDRVVGPLIAELRAAERERDVLRRDMGAVQAERDAALDGEPEPVRLRARIAQAERALREQRQRAEQAEVERDSAHRDREDQRQRAEDAEAELRKLRTRIDAREKELAARDERDAEQFQVQLREAERVAGILADRDATIAELRGKLAKPTGGDVLDWVAECPVEGHPDWYLDSESWPEQRRSCPTCEVERANAERDRLREAGARVRAWAQSWVAHTDPGHTLQGAARQVLAALDGTDGEGR